MLIAAWALTLTLDTGRAFSFPAGGWTWVTTPGIELQKGPLTFLTSINYDAFAKWDTANDHVVVEMVRKDRLTLTANGGVLVYKCYPTDWYAGVGMRIEVMRGR